MNTLEAFVNKAFSGKYRKSKGFHGVDFAVCCPFCPKKIGKQDRNFHLHISESKQVYHCFRCGESGRAASLLGKVGVLANMPDAPAVRELDKIAKYIDPGEMVDLSLLDKSHVAVKYVTRRGFNVDKLSSFYGVRYCTAGKHFAGGMITTSNTLIFPIQMRGELIGWQSRLLYDPKDMTNEECAAMGFILKEDKYMLPPKYFTMPGMTKGKVLYNFDIAKQSKAVVICEGTFDAIAAGPSSVACLGKGITEYQIDLIKSNWDLAIILLDPGDADRETDNLVLELAKSMLVVPMKLEKYKDAGEASTEAIWSQIYESASKLDINLNNINLGPNWNESVFKKEEVK